MYPTLQDLVSWAPPLDTHSFFVALALAVAGIVFMREKRRRNVRDHRIAYVVLGALMGPPFLARLGPWFRTGDLPKTVPLADRLMFATEPFLGPFFVAWLGVTMA